MVTYTKVFCCKHITSLHSMFKILSFLKVWLAISTVSEHEVFNDKHDSKFLLCGNAWCHPFQDVSWLPGKSLAIWCHCIAVLELVGQIVFIGPRPFQRILALLDQSSYILGSLHSFSKQLSIIYFRIWVEDQWYNTLCQCCNLHNTA